MEACRAFLIQDLRKYALLEVRLVLEISLIVKVFVHILEVLLALVWCKAATFLLGVLFLAAQLLAVELPVLFVPDIQITHFHD